MISSSGSSSGRASGQNQWRAFGVLVSAVNLMVIDGTVIRLIPIQGVVGVGVRWFPAGSG